MNEASRARITDHARKAVARRGMTEADIRRVIRAPQAVVRGNRSGRLVYQAVFPMGDPAEPMLVRVILDIVADPPAVVTVYATSRLTRYGAKP